MDNNRFIYVCVGGEIIVRDGIRLQYMGGQNKSLVLNMNVTYRDFLSIVSDKLKVDANLLKLYYTCNFDPMMLLLLEDDDDMKKMFQFNDIHFYVYVARNNETIVMRDHSSDPTPLVASNIVANVMTNGTTNLNLPSNVSDSDSPLDVNTNGDGEINISHRNSQQFQNVIIGIGQTFSSAKVFRDALYLTSIRWRFKYHFKRNTTKRICVICQVNGCPWKITCRSVGNSKLVQVHTFINEHNHSLEDVIASQPIFRSSRAAAIVGEVIRSTPDYQPQQLRKDFVRDHGMRLTYCQAWHIKEKAKERVFGQPKHYYKLLPWLCEKIIENNPGSIVELNYSSDAHFEQLFVAHAVSIQGFMMGCRPIIAVDSSHMSGPYGGTLFSATAYDANDNMFPIAIGVMRAESYDDWKWFLQNLKKVINDKKVVIISDRHPGLLRSVPEVFNEGNDKENHAYCYRHLKENFSSFFNKYNTKGRKGKEIALEWLDKIAYTRSEEKYNALMNELRMYDDSLADWIEDNAPEHWAMAKFPKMRWDKMTTNLAESFNAWLKNERHHSICCFLIEHMTKLAAMILKHKTESYSWKGSIGSRIEEKVKGNIAKGEVYSVRPWAEGYYGVDVGRSIFNVHILNRTCTCLGWQMSGIPCEHACAVFLSIGQDVTNFVDDFFKYPMQELAYSGMFYGVAIENMPEVHPDGVVRDVVENVVFSLNPPHTKRPPGRPRKKRIESQFHDKRTVYCSRCNTPGHNRATCKNPLA